jgi:hypothetical protein
MTSRSTPLTLLALLSVALPAGAQPPEPAAPPPPAKYDAVIRYQIDAFRNERLVQFAEMLDFFTKLGFDKAPGPEDEAEDRRHTLMDGTVGADNARKLLLERHVKALLLRPAGMKLPADKTPLRVQLELTAGPIVEPGRFVYPAEAVRRLESEGGPPLARQRELADQVRGVLAKLGFREAVGYDTRAHSRLVGTYPADALGALLEDLRRQPGAEKLPAPFATRSPLLVTEIMPAEMPPAVPRPAPPAVPKGQEKLTPELRPLVADGKAPARLEVILWATPAEDDSRWQRDLQEAAPGLIVEGRVGAVVSVVVPPAEAPALAALPVVSTVRLPRSGQPRPLPAVKGGLPEAVLRQSGLARLHALNHRGKCVRIAVIDGDFRGWDKLLPKGTRLIDLTAERNPDLLPDPQPGDPSAAGHGTQVALVASQAAPEAELVLIRIDPAAPYQLLAVARAINGDLGRSINLQRRQADVEAEREQLRQERARLLEERRAAFDDFDIDPDIEKKREAYRKKQADHDKRELAFREKVRRFWTLEADLRDLKGVRVAASGLAWNEGHPVDGGGALSRSFDDRPFRSAMWFQAAGDTRGQAWAGLFHDRDGDGVMEFLPAGAKLPAGLWSPSLGFLAWEDAGGKVAAELPAKARVRVAVQWREPHDPDFLRRGEDAYREPLAPLRLVVLRQLDPSGKKQPADDFEVVAQSVGLPQRLDNAPASATYEQTVEFVVNAPGRYAVQVEGTVPPGIRPRGAASLPVRQREWDLRLRLFVETVDGAGRAVFRDFATAEGSIGTPGDARRAMTVGAASLDGSAAPASAPGPAFNLELLPKPNVLAYESAEGGGTSLATGLAAGLAASAFSAGAVPETFDREMCGGRPGRVLRVPDGWPARR